MGPLNSATLVALVEQAFRANDVDLARVGMAWARATPAVTLVPAFGLRALPPESRAVLALALAGSIFPTLPAISASAPEAPLWVGLLQQVALGVPVALAAAIPMWAATMAGGLADTLRGVTTTEEAPTVETAATPTGVLLSLLACCLFFATGGPARVAMALIATSPAPDAVFRASVDIANGITIAVALGAPLLVASLVVEVAGALIARAASPAQLHLLLAPLRALALLVVFALVFTRLSEALASVVAHAAL